MLDKKLNKIIESIELQSRSHADRNMPEKDTDTVNLSWEELQILTGTFTDTLPDEIKVFSEVLFKNLKEYSDASEIVQLLERNKNAVLYLNSLNRILITDEYDRNLASARDYYIEKLAELYIQGSNSATIQYLLKSGNTTFLEGLGFIEDVKSAITLTERERLKKKMQVLDEWEIADLPESEVKAAIVLSERERLRKVMKDIDAGEEQGAIPIGRSIRGWRTYAIAASVIGLIGIAAIILYTDKKTTSDLVSNTSTASDTIKTAPDKKTGALAGIQSDSIELILTVKKEATMGFAVKPEKIRTHIYRFDDSLPDLPGLKKQTDSIKKLTRTYIFKGNDLFIYLEKHTLPELYKIDNKYYLGIADTFYYIRPSDKPVPAEKVTERDILNRLNKITYQQDN